MELPLIRRYPSGEFVWGSALDPRDSADKPIVMATSLSIVICTRNRREHLERCLESLLQQSVDEARFEIVVVDNGSTDDTAQAIERYARRSPNIRGLVEPRVGLSHARNTGYVKATGEWVAYIDDDATAHSDWVETLFGWIDSNECDGVGGLFLPYFDAPPPLWYLDAYNSNTWMRREGEPDYAIGPEDTTLSGGNCAFRKSVLEAVGGFDVELGMQGKRRAYSEEADLQLRILDRGYQLRFDESLRVDHFTPPEKQRLEFFVERAWCTGRDLARMRSNSHAASGSWVYELAIRGAWGALLWELRALRRVAQGFASGTYRWQNVVIDCAEPLVHYAGSLFGIARLRFMLR